MRDDEVGTLSDVREERPVGTDSTLPHDGTRRTESTLPQIDPTVYELGNEVARGGMGRVIAARDLRIGRSVVLKELLHTSASHATRFEREARVTARLQHPSIVPIYEIGKWPDGAPFYAMRMVEGRTLKAAIEQAKTFDARLALVPSVVAAAEAVAYAHAHRVIHRDLKPSNIMVGDFGETVVIDWGLAKNLATDDELAPDLGPYRDDGLTVVGSVVGTPAYMPPEQAAGEAVDERSDVYSLGAILYHLLAGEAPFHAPTTEQLIAHVRSTPPKPITAAPRDLLSIVVKAMARDPAARYANASELVTELRRYRDGQLVGAHRYSSWQLVRRWLRRHRTPVAVAALAAMLLVVVAGVSVRRILIEQTRTEQNRADAEDLMSFMLGDLRERLQQVNKIELLDAVAHKAVAFYDARGDELSLAEKQKKAHAQLAVADVLVKQEHASDAVDVLEAGIATLDGFGAERPYLVSLQCELAKAHGVLGKAFSSRAEWGNAYVQDQRWHRLARSCATIWPTEDAILSVASSDQELGRADAALGDAVSAEIHYRAAIAELENSKLASDLRQPAVQRRTLALATAREFLAASLFDRQDFAGGTELVEHAIAACEALAIPHPESHEYQACLERGHNILGLRWDLVRDATRSLEEGRKVLAAREGELARDPLNNSVLHWVANDRWAMVVPLINTGQLAEASEQARQASDELEHVSSEDPTNLDVLSDLGAAKCNLALVLLNLGRTEQALATQQSAVAVLQRTATSREIFSMEMLAYARELLGDMLFARDDIIGAIREYRGALVVRSSLTNTNSSDVDGWTRLAGTYEKIAAFLAMSGETQAALSHAALAKNGLEKLILTNPTIPNLEKDLAQARDVLCATMSVAGEDDSALVECRAAAQVLDREKKESPNEDIIEMFRIVHYDTAMLLVDRAEYANANDELRNVLEVDQRVEREPSNAAWQTELALADRLHGDVLFGLHRPTEALAAYRQALQIDTRLAALDRNPARSNALATDQTKVGDALSHSDPQLARTEYLSAIGEVTPLAPSSVTSTLALALAQQHLAKLRVASRDVSGAIELLHASYDELTTLVAKDASNLGWQLALAATDDILRRALLAHGDRDEANAISRPDLASRFPHSKRF